MQTLPCDHTFCCACLRKFVNPKKLLSCPVCHKEHLLLPDGDPSVLPTNPTLLRLLERVRSHRLARGRSFDDGAGGESVYGGRARSESRAGIGRPSRTSR